MNPNTTTEYRDLPLAVLTESATNPRRIFEDAALKELAESIRSQGVLSPLLVRPLTDQSFEIVAGARRYRAAKIAEAPTVPGPYRPPHRCRGTGGAVNRVIYSCARVFFAFMRPGTSFICNRRAGLTPNCWIQRTAATPCNGMRS